MIALPENLSSETLQRTLSASPADTTEFPGLGSIAHRLDSLSRTQLRIDRTLDTLRIRANALRRQQLEVDVLNLILLGILGYFLVRLFRSKSRKNNS